jgi:hypothetical protein
VRFLTALSLLSLVALPGMSQPRTLSGRELAATRAGAWESFLRQVAALKGPAEPVFLNGEPSGLHFPTLQETIGLRKCDSALRALERAGGDLLLSARIEAIDHSQADPRVLARAAAFLRSRNELVLAHVEKLESEMGSAAFRLVERFVSAAPPLRPYFTPVRR